MKKEHFIKDLRVKENVESIFLVKHIALLQGRDGRNYVNLILSDKTGEIEARKWNDSFSVMERIERGSYVWISGKLNNYQGRNQLIVQDISPVLKSDLNEEDFIPKTLKEVDKLFGELLDIVKALDDVYLKNLLEMILSVPEIEKKFKMWPAGKSIHHAYEGGLLEHTHSCVVLGKTLSSHYGVNKNFVIASLLLHDLCKIYEISEAPLSEYTDEGKLLGHLVKSLEIVDHFAQKIPQFPSKTRMHLKHILLSHHGALEFGSPKVPQTSEALLVHMIDLMDSQMASMELAKKNDNISGEWTSYVKHLDRIIFKGELPHYGNFAENQTLKDKDLKQNLAEKLKGFKIT